MKKLVLIIILSFITNLPYAKSKESIQARLDDLVRTIPGSTKYGIMVFDPVTRDTLYSRNILLPIKPASNTKLYTTGAALAILGTEYELSTRLLTDDEDLTDGVIDGNLYIKGYGNSLFTDRDIDSLVNRLAAMGIRKITGHVIGDDTYFDDLYSRRDWIEEDTHDALPPVSAIVINRNKIQFSLEAAHKAGGRVSFSFSPYCSMIRVKMNARTGRGKTRISISQNITENGYDFVISGSIRRKSRMIWYSAEIKNPPLFAAYLLHDRLEKSGIDVAKRPASGETPEGSTDLASRNVSLRELSKIINKQSDNFLAECLFKTIGAANSNQQGSSFYATQAISEFLNRNSISIDNININDGSGLSHSNQVTVGGIVDLLDKIYANPVLYKDYYNSLSIAGVDGTLRNRMIGTAAENNFRGKTGTLNGVIALSGYLTVQGKPDLIVSIIFEYTKGSPGRFRYLEDRIITAVAEDYTTDTQQALTAEQ